MSPSQCVILSLPILQFKIQNLKFKIRNNLFKNPIQINIHINRKSKIINRKLHNESVPVCYFLPTHFSENSQDLP